MACIRYLLQLLSLKVDRQLFSIWLWELDSILSSELYSLWEIFIAKSKAFAVSPEFYLQFMVLIQTNKYNWKD